MGCSDSKELNTLDRPLERSLTVWGDYLNSETRTILALLNIAGIPHEFEEIDIIRGDNTREAYV